MISHWDTQIDRQSFPLFQMQQTSTVECCVLILIFWYISHSVLYNALFQSWVAFDFSFESSYSSRDLEFQHFRLFILWLLYIIGGRRFHRQSGDCACKFSVWTVEQSSYGLDWIHNGKWNQILVLLNMFRTMHSVKSNLTIFFPLFLIFFLTHLFI